MMLKWMMLGAAAVAATPALAQTDDRRAAERALFEKIVEIPTVAGRTAEFRKLTTLAQGGVRQGGHHQCRDQGS